MNATAAARPATGEPKVLATYECDEGTRQLVGQRIDGRVALSDIPAGDQGKVYLVERHLPGKRELDGLVADYLALATQLGRPPLRGDWIWAKRAPAPEGRGRGGRWAVAPGCRRSGRSPLAAATATLAGALDL